MPDPSDSSDFEDENLAPSVVQSLRFDTNDLLKSTTDTFLKKNDENLMKTRIMDLIDENENKDVTKVLQFIYEFADDKNAWRTFASCLKTCSLGFARKGFSIIFDRFPFSGSFVKMYCEMEEAAKNYEIVIETLKKHLPYCVNIDLWIFCCDFFKRHLQEGKVGKQLMRARKEIEDLFSFAVDTVGFFVDSTDLWIRYLDFLKDQTPSDEYIGEYNLQRRKFYHRVVTIPLDWLEEAWSSYRVFEESASRTHDAEEQKMIASKQMQAVDDQHNLAKEVLKERSMIWQYITDDNLPMRILTEESKNQVDCWMKYIRYEMTNPMKLSREQLYHQLHMTYMRCLSCCYYCPDVWLSFAQFEALYDWKRAVNVMSVSVNAVPDSIILHLACCDFYEEQNQIDDAMNAYEEIVRTSKEPTAWIKYLQFVRRQKGMKECRSFFQRACEQALSPELVVAEADIEYHVNLDETAALNVYRYGMNFFSNQFYYVSSFCDFLLQLKQIDTAIKLLQESVEKMEGDDKSRIWEKIIQINARYKLTNPIASTLALEERYRKANPSDRNCPVVEDVSRYIMWGCSLQSPADKSMIKRKYPFHPKKEEELPVKVFEVDIASLAAPMEESEARRMELPPWLENIKRILPMAGQKNARGNEVDKLVDLLKEITLPSEEKLQLV